MHASAERPQRVIGFGVFEVDVASRELRKQGRRIRLQEQPFQVLEMLLERPGDLVTREELRQTLWSGSVYVDFDHGLNNAIARLREVLGDNATAAHFIETVPRNGYRFIYPLRSLAVTDTPAIATSPADTVAPPPVVVAVKRKRWPLVAAGIALLLAVLLPLALTDRHGNDNAANVVATAPSIAVLPFANLSPDAEDEHFSDGLTDEIVTRLAGIRGLKVVARTSSFQFKDKQESTTAIAQALQVDHLIEGSVSRSGARLRIAVQLIDAHKDARIWSQTFDRDAGDIFQIQEDIAFAVAAALNVPVLDAEAQRIRRRGTNDPEAYRLLMIAQSHIAGRTRTADLSVAKRSLDAAIERDPNFAAAHAALAQYYFRRAWGTLTDPEESARLGAAEAERAVVLDAGSSDALRARANFEFWRYRFLGDYAAYVAAQSDMQRAIELDPTNAGAFTDFGRGIFWNEPDLAVSLSERAIQLDLLCSGLNVSIASLLGSRGQVDAARVRCADVLDHAPDSFACQMAIGTLETYFGHFDKALGPLRASEQSIKGPARIELWSVHMSMGDRAGAQQWLDFGKTPMEKSLSDAARSAMDGRYEQSFTVLQQYREAFPLSRLLDLPTAKFALIAGKPQQALAILQQRLPDLASGIEPISARNLLPALDLATAELNTGARNDARTLLDRIVVYLDGTSALRLPMFAVERARAHALGGEPDAAQRALDRAYDEGLRVVWALDLRPQSSLYIDPIDADPAFDAMHTDPRFRAWFARIDADNAHQLEQLSGTQVAKNQD